MAAMDRWPPYGGGREGRFDCIYKKYFLKMIIIYNCLDVFYTMVSI